MTQDERVQVLYGLIQPPTVAKAATRREPGACQAYRIVTLDCGTQIKLPFSISFFDRKTRKSKQVRALSERGILSRKAVAAMVQSGELDGEPLDLELLGIVRKSLDAAPDLKPVYNNAVGWLREGLAEVADRIDEFSRAIGNNDPRPLAPTPRAFLQVMADLDKDLDRLVANAEDDSALAGPRKWLGPLVAGAKKQLGNIRAAIGRGMIDGKGASRASKELKDLAAQFRKRSEAK